MRLPSGGLYANDLSTVVGEQGRRQGGRGAGFGDRAPTAEPTGIVVLLGTVRDLQHLSITVPVRPVDTPHTPS